MAEEQKNTLTVDGKEYEIDTLSDNAKNIVRNVQFCDQEITRQRMAGAAVQTARQAYITALKNELEGGNSSNGVDAEAE